MTEKKQEQIVTATPDPILAFKAAAERFRSTIRSSFEELQNKLSYELKKAVHEVCDEMIRQFHENDDVSTDASPQKAEIKPYSPQATLDSPILDSQNVKLENEFPQYPLIGHVYSKLGVEHISVISYNVCDVKRVFGCYGNTSIVALTHVKQQKKHEEESGTLCIVVPSDEYRVYVLAATPRNAHEFLFFPGYVNVADKISWLRCSEELALLDEMYVWDPGQVNGHRGIFWINFKEQIDKAEVKPFLMRGSYGRYESITVYNRAYGAGGYNSQKLGKGCYHAVGYKKTRDMATELEELVEFLLSPSHVKKAVVEFVSGLTCSEEGLQSLPRYSEILLPSLSRLLSESKEIKDHVSQVWHRWKNKSMVKWTNEPVEKALWELLFELKKRFSDFEP